MRALAGGRVVIALAAAAVIAWLPTHMSGYHQLEGAGVAVFFIGILGLNVLTGYTGQISLGHGAFMAIGGYTSAILYRDHHWSPIATLPLAAAVAFAAGVLVGIPALRLRGVHLALATFALAVSIPALIRHFSKFTSGTGGIFLPFHTDRYLYVLCWIVGGIMFVLGWLILRSGVGRSFRAVRDSEVAAPTLSIRILIGAAVGGFGSLWGVVGGAAFVYLLPLWTASISNTGGPPLVFQGAAVILVMLLLPTGLGGLLRRLAALLTNRVAGLTNRTRTAS